MTAISNALVVGGGSAGAAVAILLARGGVVVDLVEINPDVIALGSGIALHGNGLRVLETLGVLDACVEQGYPFSTVAIRAPDSHATVLAELDSFRTGGPDLPAALGMYRPDLARILMSAAQVAGVAKAAEFDRGVRGAARSSLRACVNRSSGVRSAAPRRLRCSSR